MNWDASVRGRLGYLVTPDTLIYGTGGVAFQNIEAFGQCGSLISSALCFTTTGQTAPSPGITQSTTLVGWTIGAGVEAHLWGNWLLRAEYRYADFGAWQHFLCVSFPRSRGRQQYISAQQLRKHKHRNGWARI